MAGLSLLVNSNLLEWNVEELKEPVHINPGTLYDASVPQGEQGGGESDVALGANTLAIPQFKWWYGFTDTIETCVGEELQILEVCLDCIELIGFEISAQSFAVFYPPGVDGVEGPSVDFVYRDSLDTRNTPGDLVNLPPENVARHIQAAEELMKKQRGVLRIRGEELNRIFEEHRWYIVGLDSKTGAPATFYPFPDAFAEQKGEALRIRWILEPDPLTRRRLERVISLDFVCDLNLEPPPDPDTEVPPILVLLPSEEDLKGEHWRDWEQHIADLGPLVWDEELAPFKLPDPPVEQSTVPTSEEQAVDAGSKDETIVPSPVTPKKKEGVQAAPDLKGKAKGKVKDQKRKPLAEIHGPQPRPKLHSSPIADKRRERSRVAPPKFTIYEDP